MARLGAITDQVMSIKDMSDTLVSEYESDEDLPNMIQSAGIIRDRAGDLHAALEGVETSLKSIA